MFCKKVVSTEKNIVCNCIYDSFSLPYGVSFFSILIVFSGVGRASVGSGVVNKTIKLQSIPPHPISQKHLFVFVQTLWQQNQKRPSTRVIAIVKLQQKTTARDREWEEEKVEKKYLKFNYWNDIKNY